MSSQMEPRNASTLAELAKLAGVSIATVSRSLAGSAMIKNSTRERIVALAQEHGFKINQAARNFRLKKTHAIGVVLPLGHEIDQHLSDPFFMGLLGPIADALAERGHDLLLSRVIPSNDRWLDAIVDTGRVDGVIVIGQSNQIAAIERVACRYRPIVVWGADVPGHQQITVGSDNVAGGRVAAEHLLRQGRTRLAFFGNPGVPEFAARYDGFRQVIEEAGLGAGTLLPVHLTTEASYAAIAEFLTGNPPPDGVVAASDVIAMSALQVLGERGVRVPQDVGVIGYDDVVVAKYTNPPLTTVRQDVERGAKLLVELLFQRMEGVETTSVSMTPDLVLRGSA
jgi:DNA-binding LacI/PurR family transcriptional regulator